MLPLLSFVHDQLLLYLHPSLLARIIFSSAIYAQTILIYSPNSL